MTASGKVILATLLAAIGLGIVFGLGSSPGVQAPRNEVTLYFETTNVTTVPIVTK